MEKTIVGIQYKNKRTGEFDGRMYNYFCTLPVKIGDVVIAPTANGNSVAMIREVNVPESKIDARVMPIMKTITAFAESEG